MRWLKIFFYVLCIVLAFLGARSLLPAAESNLDIYTATDLLKQSDGLIGFNSFNAKSGSDFMDGGVNAVRQTSGGTLILPIDASAEKKVPAMVILHGSGGDWGKGRGLNLSLFLARQGIAGLAVDTFGSRDLSAGDDYRERLDKAPIYTQMSDALSALQALQQHPFIDSAKIGVTGFSLGAGSTLYMMFEPVIENVLGKDGPRFSAYAMFYGGCMVEFDDFRVEGSPLLIMMGGADESMSIPGCERFRDRLIDLGVDVELKVYEAAGHGWDAPFPQQFFADKWVTRDCLMRWTKSGEAVEMTSGYSMDNAFGVFMALSQCGHQKGYTNGFNEDAFAGSRRDLLQFLTATWNLQ
jgi:dienelactone hydrolase